MNLETALETDDAAPMFSSTCGAKKMVEEHSDYLGKSEA